MGLMDLFGKRDTIYFPGCITYFKFKEGFDLYRKIFSRLGIKARVLDEQRCSGFEVWEAGYDYEMRKIIRKNSDIFKAENVKKIIATEPGCYKIFVKDYPEILPYWDVEVVNIWDLILDKLIKKRWLVENRDEIVTFHDSCYLGRYCGIYDAPREILNLLGYQIKEMDNAKDNSYCCGSCGGLARMSPELANKIAKERILQAKRIGVDKVIVVGYENYSLLNDNVGDTGVEIYELGQILADSLGINFIDFNKNRLDEEQEILIETEANMRLQSELKEEVFYDEEK